MPVKAVHSTVFLVSAVGIAYQVALMRIFSIAQWHHFAYMIISIAMLGFGAGGTLVALSGKYAERPGPSVLTPLITLLGASLPLCYALSQRVLFETFELVSRTGPQLGCLLVLYVLLSIPFFLVSLCITLALLQCSGHLGRLYCSTMLGSGAGALAMMGLLAYVHPRYLPALMAVLLLPALLLAGGACPRYPVKRTAAGIVLVLLATWAGLGPIRLSAYKGLSYAMQYPDARQITEAVSPLSVLTVVDSDQIRETPGQVSFSYPWSEQGGLPAQMGLYFDGGGMSPIARFDGNTEKFAYLDYTTPALAYHLGNYPETLVIGAGGGTDVLAALYHGASRVTAVEINPAVFRLLEANEEIRQFSGSLYERPEVVPVVADGRGFLQSGADRYDLIQVALPDSFVAASAGVHSLSESYLYTIEAFQLFLERLNPQGALSVTCWLKMPPREALKLFATAVAACERTGMADPGAHIAFIRSWNTATLVVTRAALTEGQVGSVRAFCDTRGFDMSCLPGLREDEANRYTVLEEDTYFAFAREILNGTREDVLDASVFYLRPATDDRPYFFHFLKWSALPRLWRAMGMQWAPFVEWGYITLTATFVQGVLVSALLILLPLLTLSGSMKGGYGKRWVIAYFAGLGLAYMFLEIAVIQRLVLFLAYPVHAVTVTLAGFLVFSGLGSLAADGLYRRRGPEGAHRTTAAAAGFILAVVLLHILFLPALFRFGAGWPDTVKTGAALLVIAPLAFAMGLPFPTGLQRVTAMDKRLLPWAWGINGCCSVIGATGGALIAIHGGFTLLTCCAALIYLGCAAALARLKKRAM